MQGPPVMVRLLILVRQVGRRAEQLPLMRSSNAVLHLSARAVLMFGRSVAISGGAVAAITPSESSKADLPNVELIVETVHSCERSWLCMRLHDRHLAFQGAINSAPPHPRPSTACIATLLCLLRSSSVWLFDARGRVGSPAGKIKLRCPPGFRLRSVYVTNEPAT